MSSSEDTEIRSVQACYQYWATYNREKFLSLLVQKYSDDPATFLRNFESLSVSCDISSIFQCQLRQFLTWFDAWSPKAIYI
ncbi:hypothetical protein JTE90_018290 [Oedothorax gibbosus]|uniref:Uncharacterized protein n=1 Tax=Oedothorax gibbosus TaxID=931172 RepID=A0AAV6UEI2_9ARAC|nr:hypothetical protein JTE90_018290 [Oedothorax gibbosus]